MPKTQKVKTCRPREIILVAVLNSNIIQLGQSDLKFDLQSKGEISDDECAILVEQGLTTFDAWTDHCAIHKTTAIDNLRNGRQFCNLREKRKRLKKWSPSGSSKKKHA